MRSTAVCLLALSASLPLLANADSDVGGHKHAGASDHHTMHDQLSDKPWEFYGALYLGLQLNDPGSEESHDGDKPDSNLFLNSEGTTIGFRGSFPLDGGLKAVWQVESTVNLDEVAGCADEGHTHGTQPSNCNGSVLAGGHNTFLGLSGDFGTILAGKHNTPYFDATIQFDLFHHLPGDMRAILGSIPGVDSGTGDHHASTFNASAPDMLMYKSPNFGGFSFEAAIFGMNETITKTDDKPSAFGLGLRYASEMFTLVAAYETHKNFDTTEADLVAPVGDETYMVDSTTAMVVGGMVHLNEGNTMVGAFIERLSADDDLVSDESRTGYYVNFQQRFMGKNKLKAALAVANEFEDKDGATMFAIAYARELGTGTEAYVTYAATRNDEEAAYSNGVVGPLGHGGDPSTFAVGLVHMF